MKLKESYEKYFIYNENEKNLNKKINYLKMKY